jgi:hypothetical protein
MRKLRKGDLVTVQGYGEGWNTAEFPIPTLSIVDERRVLDAKGKDTGYKEYLVMNVLTRKHMLLPADTLVLINKKEKIMKSLKE